KDEESSGQADDLCNVPGMGELLRLPRSHDGAWWDEVTRRLERPFVAAIASSELLEVHSHSVLLRDIDNAVEAARGVAAQASEPILLSTSWCERGVASAYLDHVLDSSADQLALDRAG